LTPFFVLSAFLSLTREFQDSEKKQIAVKVTIAVVTVGIILYLSTSMKRLIGDQGLVILPKITGLFVSAIAAQIIFTGVQNFLKLG